MANSADKSQIDPDRIPRHVAIIMDGNGRWARQKGHLRIFGHKHGVRTVRNVIEAAVELGIQYLTLYAFSTENWNRPEAEVNALMELLVQTIKGETPTMMENGIRLQAIGNIEKLPPGCNKQLQETVNTTKDNKRMTLILALSYSGRWDIIEAVRKIADQVKSGTIQPEEINEEVLGAALNTAAYPNPDLLIRTSGEHRISNFLLWEIAYSEFHFTPVLWPDFTPDDLYKAVLDYQGRQRRFGKTGEQIQPVH
ncbi:MAG: isoprenyl transferase [Bacteroidetes bacterium]|nr:isoprenyl transferase [Bacteroidota bacterium]